MPRRILVRDGDKYAGKYVATKSFKSKKILCAGTDPLKVIQEAKEMGAKDPVLMFVPKKGMTHIYSVRNISPYSSGIRFLSNSGAV